MRGGQKRGVKKDNVGKPGGLLKRDKQIGERFFVWGINSGGDGFYHRDVANTWRPLPRTSGGKRKIRKKKEKTRASDKKHIPPS